MLLVSSGSQVVYLSDEHRESATTAPARLQPLTCAKVVTEVCKRGLGILRRVTSFLLHFCCHGQLADSLRTVVFVSELLSAVPRPLSTAHHQSAAPEDAHFHTPLDQIRAARRRAAA